MKYVPLIVAVVTVVVLAWVNPKMLRKDCQCPHHGSGVIEPCNCPPDYVLLIVVGVVMGVLTSLLTAKSFDIAAPVKDVASSISI